MFVLRYAYGLYQKREQKVTRRDVNNSLRQYITEDVWFDFGMSNIRDMRVMMRDELVDRLSEFYVGVRKAELEEERKEKKMRKGKKKKEGVVEEKENEDKDKEKGDNKLGIDI